MVDGQEVDWSGLKTWQETMTRARFERQIATVLCPSGAMTNYWAMSPRSVKLYKSADRSGPPVCELRFRKDEPDAEATTGTGTEWRVRTVCLDPGHIGGEWARMEERFFQRGNDRPVQEGILNLTVARLVRDQLEALGVRVVMTRNNLSPVTEERPTDFREAALEYGRTLTEYDAWPPLEREAALADAVGRHQEQLFYRSSEIAARARLVNEQFKPDLTICIHFNAAPWNERFDLVDENRLVVFTHGNYLAGEVADPVQRHRLLVKLFQGVHRTELAVAESLARSLAEATGLLPAEYPPGGNAHRVGNNPYVYARNLAANRLYDGPVVFLEPYYMNNRTVYHRIQMGDYEGTREVEGRQVKSIYREYADAVVNGLRPFLSPPRSP
jgi:hypothetical protein